MTHADLVAALREIDGLRDVGRGTHPNFHFRSRPFLHFHFDGAAIRADVRFGGGDFEVAPASTPRERELLLARVRTHVRRVAGERKDRRRSSARRR